MADDVATSSGVSDKADRCGWDNFRLLHEEVVATDSFKHKTHQNVADSLCEIIHREDRGATVGLEGSWGGGKSTVIHILKRKLKGIGFVFTFDAWAHEENCLRRVFLESIIDAFRSAIKTPDREQTQLKGDDAWLKDKLDEIDGKKNTATVTTDRTPTWTGLFAVISSFVVAIGIALVSECKRADDSIDWRFTWWVLVAFAFPFIVACARAFWLHFKERKSLRKAESWAFVTKRAKETVVREVSDTEERSSIEFEKYFSQIMEQMVAWNKGIKFVLAIDNLDRIDGKRSLSLWSTLQTFLQRRSDSRYAEDWFKKVWILVPYDAEGLEKVWNLEDAQADKKRAKSFLDKSFQVRVEVPRPVMTDWESYARDLISELLGKADSEDQEDILRILKITRNGIANIPTPREIKNYVNQVAVFRNQHDSAIATKTIAYYVIKRFVDQERMSTDMIRAELLAGTFPQAKDRPYLPSDAARQFAGIVFGVTPTDGQQLLLIPEISAALNDGKTEDFDVLMENHGEGALVAFDSYVSEGIQWNDEKEIGSFVNILSCVAGCKISSNRLRTLADKVAAYVKVLCGKDAALLGAFLPADKTQLERVGACVKKVCELVDKSVAKTFHRQMCKTVAAIVGGKDDIDATSLGLASSSVLGAFPDSARTDATTVNFGVVKLAKFSKSLLPLDYSVAKQLKPAQNTTAEIVKAILPNTAIQPYLGRAVKYVIESNVNADWTGVADAAIKHIMANTGYSNPDIPSRRALDVLLFIAPLDKKYRDLIAGLLKKGEFYNFVGSNPGERARKAALLLAVCNPNGIQSLSCDRQFGSVPQGLHVIGNVFNSVSPEDTKPLLNLIREFGVEDSLRGFFTNSKWKMFGTLIDFSVRDPAYEWFNYDDKDPLDSVWVYGAYLKCDGAADRENKVHQYIEVLQEKHNAIGRVESIGFEEDDLRYCASYIQYILNREGCSKGLWNNAATACKKLNEIVLKELMEHGDFRQLVMLVKKNVEGFELGVDFYKALRDVMSLSDEDCLRIRKGVIENCKGDEWIEFVGAMRGSYKESLDADITKAFEELEFTDKPSYYSLNRDMIDVEDVGDAVLTDIVWQGLVNGNGRFDLINLAKDLIARKLETDASWTPSEDSKEKLQEPFEQLFEKEANEDNQMLLKDLAMHYGVVLPKREEVKTNSEDSTPSEA